MSLRDLSNSLAAVYALFDDGRYRWMERVATE